MIKNTNFGEDADEKTIFDDDGIIYSAFGWLRSAGAGEGRWQRQDAVNGAGCDGHGAALQQKAAAHCEPKRVH